MFCSDLKTLLISNDHHNWHLHTVKPFDRVVYSVLDGVTGLAYLRNGATELRALLTLEACRKLYASLWEAMIGTAGDIASVQETSDCSPELLQYFEEVAMELTQAG